MTPQQVIAHFGSIAATARALSIKSPSVSGWVAKGEIPVGRQCQIELVTGGQLTAEHRALHIPPGIERRSGQDRRRPERSSERLG